MGTQPGEAVGPLDIRSDVGDSMLFASTDGPAG